MYRNTPSHNIQQKADMKKYCNSAATDLQASFINNIHNDQQYSDIAALLYLTVSAKTLHFHMQILAYFWSLKSHNSVAAECNVIKFSALIA